MNHTTRLDEEQIVARAQAFASPAEQAAFLAGVCGQDAELMRRVRAALSAREIGAKPTVQCATASGSARVIEGPGAVIGRYRILEKIGEGGFGVVYVAEQREPVKRRVALKIIKLGMDTRQVVARFEAERQALALMDHHNIARVLDAGATETGRPFFVMELVRGIRITDYCDQHRLGPTERLGLFVRVCHAIQHAHQKGIIHRDIKPSNILVTLHDGVPVPKVIDFGIAKATQQELTDKTLYTHLQQFVGTPDYMSPEQAEMSGLDIDTRSDIYSLGVLLYELLTGKTPFDTQALLAAGLDALRRTIREEEPLRPSTRLSTMADAELTAAAQRRSAEGPGLIHLLRGDLDWIVMKCLEKDRTRRYETANGLAMDIQRYLRSEPVLARPPTRAYRFRKAWRRNKVVYSAGLAVALALVAGALASSLGLLRATRDRARAESEAERATKAGAEAQLARELVQSKAAELETNLYFSHIAWAHREVSSQPANLVRAQMLLEETSSRLRDWEWHYVRRRRFAEPTVLPGSNKVHSVAFSGEGRYLTSAQGDGRVRIWDLEKPDKPAGELSAGSAFVVSVAFSPVNSHWLAFSASDKRLRLADWRTGEELHSWHCHADLDYGMAYAVVFSPDGTRLAAPGAPGEVQVCDVLSGRVLHMLTADKTLLMSTAFSPDGLKLATGNAKGFVRVWDAAAGRMLESFGQEGPPIARVQFSADGRNLFAQGFDGVLKRWNPATMGEHVVFRTGGPPVVAFASTPVASRVATGGFDRLVRIWDPARAREVVVFRELDSSCYCVAFSPDGNQLAAGSRSGAVVMWDATPLNGNEDRSLLTMEYPGEVWSLDISRNGRSIAVGGYSSPGGNGAPVLLWDRPDKSPSATVPGYPVIVFSIAHDPTGRFLAFSGDETTRPGRAMIKVWDREAGCEAYPVESFAGDGRIFSVAFSPNGRWLVGAGNDKVIKAWDAASGRKVGVIGRHSHEITKLTFSPDGRYLATIGNDDLVKLWDGTRLDQPQSDPSVLPALCGGFADSLAFSSDSRRLAVPRDDNTIRIYDLQAGPQALELACPGHRPLAVCFSPDPESRWLASGGVDCAVKVWDARSGKLCHTFKSHIRQVTRLAFLRRPEGFWLASASHDGTVKFWDLPPPASD